MTNPETDLPRRVEWRVRLFTRYFRRWMIRCIKRRTVERFNVTQLCIGHIRRLFHEFIN